MSRSIFLAVLLAHAPIVFDPERLVIQQIQGNKMIWEARIVNIFRLLNTKPAIYANHVFTAYRPNTIAALDSRSGHVIVEYCIEYNYMCRFMNTGSDLICVTDCTYARFNANLELVEHKALGFICTGMLDENTLLSKKNVYDKHSTLIRTRTKHDKSKI